jgi:HPt (histidine-containing phosphotransfer) domain-containing protein
MAGFELNRDLILARLGGDESLLAMIVDLFLEECENNCALLENAWIKRDIPSLAREAHTIKGLLLTVSDEAGSAFAYALETQARQGNTDGLDVAVAGVLARMREVAEVLGRR